MRYMGSKNRLAKDIVPIIQSYIIRGGKPLHRAFYWRG